MGLYAMPNSSHPANAVAGGFLAFFGLAFLATGAGVLLGDSDLGPTRPFYFVAAIVGASLLLGGVRMMVAQRRSQHDETRHRASMRAAVGPPPLPHEPAVFVRPPAAATGADAAPSAAVPAPPAAFRIPTPKPAHAALPSGEPVLAHWTYAAGEWKTYMAAEWKRRLWEGVFLGPAMAGIAWTILRKQPEMNVPLMALAVGVFFFLVPLLRAMAARQTDPSGPAEAIITPTAVLLNGRYHVLEDGRIRFGGVQLTELGKAQVLEFTVTWPTRGGMSSEHLRVPVPAGRRAEAEAIVGTFARGWSADTPWLDGQANSPGTPAAEA
jgi:hypothetical protein